MVTPLDGLELMAGVALLDSEVDAVPVPFGGLIKAEFPLAPSFALNFLGRYEWPALGGTMAVQIDGNHNGDHFLEGTNSAVSFEDSYTVVNAHVSYTSPGDRWTATVWVKNVTDTDYRLYNLDLGLLGFIEQVYAPPQWFGGTISYSWQ
jgi:iron complex outermembrane receptor protein